MTSNTFVQLQALLVLAQERSFTTAASRLGVSPSALSKTIRLLEDRLGKLVVIRTTRSVSLTEAGRRLVEETAPAFVVIREAIATAGSDEDNPIGKVTINMPLLAGEIVFTPALARFAEQYPRVQIEFVAEDAYGDVVAQGCDAGVRLGPAVQQDMVAVPISRKLPTALVASATYLQSRQPLAHPNDFKHHDRLCYRWSATGSLFEWQLNHEGRVFNFGGDGRFVFNDTNMILRAAIAGAGVAMILKDRAQPHLDDGSLVSVLGEWCPIWPAYHLYFPRARHMSPALRAVIDFFRVRDV